MPQTSGGWSLNLKPEVAEIMIAVSSNGGEWLKAFDELIPKRKGAKQIDEVDDDGEEGAEAEADDSQAVVSSVAAPDTSKSITSN